MLDSFLESLDRRFTWQYSVGIGGEDAFFKLHDMQAGVTLFATVIKGSVTWGMASSGVTEVILNKEQCKKTEEIIRSLFQQEISK